MAKGIICKLRKTIDECDKKNYGQSTIENTRKILLREINGDRDKLLNVKANLITSGNLSEVAVTISVLALLGSVFGGAIINVVVLIVCLILLNVVQKQNEGNKYIRVVVEDIENNWLQYFEGTQIADSEKAEQIYIVKVKQN